MLFASQATSRAQDLDLLLQDQLGGLGQAVSGGEVEFTGSFKLKTDTGKGILNLASNISKGWHIFSVTQKSGGPIASTITVAESDQYKVLKSTKARSLGQFRLKLPKASIPRALKSR